MVPKDWKNKKVDDSFYTSYLLPSPHRPLKLKSTSIKRKAYGRLMAINLLQNTSSENLRVFLQNIFFPVHFGLTDVLSVATAWLRLQKVGQNLECNLCQPMNVKEIQVSCKTWRENRKNTVRPLVENEDSVTFPMLESFQSLFTKFCV